MPVWGDFWVQSGSQKPQVLGLCFVFCVAVIWVAASFLVQDLESQGLNPFVLTYIANTLFVVLLPVSALSKRRKVAATPRSSPEVPDSEGKQLLASGSQTDVITNDLTEHAPLWKQALGNQQIQRAALVVAPLWFGAQLTFNSSLSLTNVTSNTILSSTSSLFTFGLSCLLLGEAYTFIKLLSILVCIAGVAMVTFGDRSNAGGHQSFLGDMLCLVSSVFYASYTIAIRKMLPDDACADVTTFFGFIGLLNLVGMAPVLFILWLIGAVQLQGITARLISLAVCKGLFDNVLSDYLWARAVLLIGPTVATVGLSIQVPLAVAAEGSFGKPAWLDSHGSTALMLLGAIAVIAGFLGVSFNINTGAEEEATAGSQAAETEVSAPSV